MVVKQKEVKEKADKYDMCCVIADVGLWNVIASPVLKKLSKATKVK